MEQEREVFAKRYGMLVQDRVSDFGKKPGGVWTGEQCEVCGAPNGDMGICTVSPAHDSDGSGFVDAEYIYTGAKELVGVSLMVRQTGPIWAHFHLRRESHVKGTLAGFTAYHVIDPQVAAKVVKHFAERAGVKTP